MKRILVPTDFSKHAEYALKVAAQIAKKNNWAYVMICEDDILFIYKEEVLDGLVSGLHII